MRSSIILTKLVALASLLLHAKAFDVGGLPPKVLENISQTPSCAMSCILDSHWAKTYAPECSQLPFGTEYGARLCTNSIYQYMIDHCIKQKCNENDRKQVYINFLKLILTVRHENWGKALVKLLEFK